MRIRAATLTNHAKGYTNTFGMRHHSNILALPYPCKLAQDMLFDEVQAVKHFEKQCLVAGEALMHPIVVSEITDLEKRHQPVVSLKQLLSEEQAKNARVRLQVCGIQSFKDVSECIKAIDKTTE